MSSDTEVTSTADVVVVGSGSAGAVVARRLVDAGASVLLLEAGLPDDNPAIHDPARLFELWDSEQDWGYRTVPQAACAGRELHWPRGRVLGGIERAQRDDLRARAPEATTTAGLRSATTAGGTTTSSRCSSARRTSTAVRTSTTARAGSCR